MNATATTTKTPSASRKAAKHIQAGYTRPMQIFRPEIGKTAEERLALLRATLRTADEKIEAAYDAAERGTPVDVLLHLIAHELLCTAMHPVLRNEDETGIPVTKSDLDTAHDALFPVLAALEGAMALTAGTVLSATLAEAFNLLDWAQEECDGAALGKLLPDAAEEVSLASPGQEAANSDTGESDPRTRIAEALAVLFAAAREHACAEVWGVHSLAALIERTFDSANPEDADDLQEVSNLLEQVLAVIDKVNTDALDCMLLHASTSLLTTAKHLVDDKCEAVS